MLLSYSWETGSLPVMKVTISQVCSIHIEKKLDDHINREKDETKLRLYELVEESALGVEVRGYKDKKAAVSPSQQLKTA